MELKAYDIIKRVIMSEKSASLFNKLGHITFEINPKANRSMVKHAVEKLWDVKVDTVRVMNVKGKNKTFARRQFKTSDRKKAIVVLKQGYKIDLPGQFDGMHAPAAENVEAGGN